MLGWVGYVLCVMCDVLCPACSVCRCMPLTDAEKVQIGENGLRSDETSWILQRCSTSSGGDDCATA